MGVPVELLPTPDWSGPDWAGLAGLAVVGLCFALKTKGRDEKDDRGV